MNYYIGSKPVSIDDYVAHDKQCRAALAAARRLEVDVDVAVQYAEGLATDVDLIDVVGADAAQAIYDAIVAA